jgi:hypothetical protein
VKKKADRLQHLCVALMMEVASTPEKLVNFQQVTRHNNPEDSHNHIMTLSRIFYFEPFSHVQFCQYLLADKYFKTDI